MSARRIGKRDSNERSIIAALEALQCTVCQLDGGDGKPDLLVGEPRHRSNFIIEVKVPGEGRLTVKQKQFHAGWAGRIHLVETESQAVAVAVRYMQPGGFSGIHERGPTAVLHTKTVSGVVAGGQR